MMAVSDSGGTVSTMGAVTWASVLNKSWSPSLNKNVLEVVLERDGRGGFSISDSDCYKLLKKIGLDTVKIEEIQICPNGRGVIIITLKSDVDIEQAQESLAAAMSLSGIITS